MMLPHIRGRPVTMERYPAASARRASFRRTCRRGFPTWLERVEVPKKDGTVHHPLVTDARSLLWMANQNCITPHVWTSRAPDLYMPDVCVFDLDPSEDDKPEVLRGAALGLRDLLDELGLAKLGEDLRVEGLPHPRPARWQDQNRTMSRASRIRSGQFSSGGTPTHLTQEFSKADRGGRILVDTGRNGYSATFAAAYAVRARTGAPVSAPCTWDEIERGVVGPQTFTLRTMAARIAEVGELWADMRRRKRSLRGPMERVGKLRK